MACAQPHWLDGASSGLDSPESEADVGIDLMSDGNLDGALDQSLRLQGPVTVRRTAPLDQSVNFPGQGSADNHKDVIDTEILGMALTGGGFTLRAGAGQGAGAAIAATKGTILEQPADATKADSFFDVFFEVAVPGGTYVYNQTPLRVSSVIDCVPPVASYVHPEDVIPLYDSPVPGQGNHVANLVSARHRVGPRPPGLDCALTGPAAACTATSNVHGVTASLTPATYAWSVSGNGTIVGPSNLAQATVLASPTAGAYTVRVIVTTGTLADTCEKQVSVVTQGCGNVAVGTPSVIERFELGPPMPNPTGGVARMEFSVPRESYVEVTVHDIQGRRLAFLAAGRYRPGRYQIAWSGEIDRHRAPTGLYFIRYMTPERTLVRRVVVVH